MTQPKSCAARPGADQQMRCGRCGLVWDIDDPEPPACRPEPVPKPKVKRPSKKARLVQIVAGIATTAACLKYLT